MGIRSLQPALHIGLPPTQRGVNHRQQQTMIASARDRLLQVFATVEDHDLNLCIPLDAGSNPDDVVRQVRSILAENPAIDLHVTQSGSGLKRHIPKRPEATD